MKCPYRTTESYFKNATSFSDGSGNYSPHKVVFGCKKEDAHFVTNDFMDCTETECAAYENGKCKRLEANQ